MARETAIDARVIGATVKIEICKKVEKKFRLKASDALSAIYARALEESVRGVELTAKEYREIAAETEANYKKRMAKRRANKSTSK